PARRPAEVPKRMVQHAAAVVRRIRWRARDVARFLGEYLSAPKPQTVFSRPRSPRSRARFAALSRPRGMGLELRTRLVFRDRDCLEGFNRLLGIARRELRIFDPDLSELEMNSTSRIETLTRFLRESRARRIYVALHDIEHVTKRCPRLIALMSSYTSALLIFQT